MDALPITETGSHDHLSATDGVMHACGHDGHMTMLLGAAELLSRDKDFDGTVVFVFQPNEEHGLGARAMIDEGMLDRFPIDEVYAIHNLPGAPLGQVSTRPGLICSSESLFEITISGRGGHASMPQVGVDAITVGAEMVQAPANHRFAQTGARRRRGGVGHRVPDRRPAQCAARTGDTEGRRPGKNARRPHRHRGLHPPDRRRLSPRFTE